MKSARKHSAPRQGWRTLLVIGVSLWGCGAPLEEGAPTAPGTLVAATLPEGRWPTQGRHLLGLELGRDGNGEEVLRPVSLLGARDAGGQPLDLLVVQGRLKGSRAGAELSLIGALLQSPGLTLRIQAIRILGANERQYRVLRVRPDGTSLPLCDPLVDGNDADNWAWAVATTWTPDGAGSATPGAFSFSCSAGVVAKCIEWGYRPWSDASLHQACTRMARADYCGDGRSQTFDGTLIRPFDLLSPRINAEPGSGPPTPRHAAFEGAWGPSGALCLSQVRWAGISGGLACGNLVGAPACNSLTEAIWKTRGAILFNYAKAIDVPLYRWQNGATSDHYTTSGLPTSPPESGYGHPVFEGSVYKEARPGTVPLYVHTRGNDRYTTTLASAPGYSGSKIVGYLYPDQEAAPAIVPRIHLAALYAFTNRSDGSNGADILTQVWSPGSPAPLLGYVPQRVSGGSPIPEGWVLKASLP